MKKYLSVYKISFIQEFAYKANFIMWRVRNVLQMFLVYFLWKSIYENGSQSYFGYTESQMLTYVFLVLIVRAFVLSSRAIDVSGEIARGDLANYLLKPVSFFKYYFTKDLSSKSLNFIFAFFEVIIMYLILKPPFFLQNNPVYLTGFIVAIVLAIVMYFILTMITSFVPFWIPEAAWGVNFMFTAIFIEFFSGAVFPLDILPETLYRILTYTPFPYLIYFPIQIYLGQLAYPIMLKGIVVMAVWIGILLLSMNSLWNKGLKVFQVHGK